MPDLNSLHSKLSTYEPESFDLSLQEFDDLMRTDDEYAYDTWEYLVNHQDADVGNLSFEEFKSSMGIQAVEDEAADELVAETVETTDPILANVERDEAGVEKDPTAMDSILEGTGLTSVETDDTIGEIQDAKTTQELEKEIGDLEAEEKIKDIIYPGYNDIVDNLFTDDTIVYNSETDEEEVVKGGALGLTIEEQKEIDEKVNNPNLFSDREKTEYVIMAAGPNESYTVSVPSPWIGELEAARKELTAWNQSHNLQPPTEKEILELAKEKVRDVLINQTRASKWEDFEEGGIGQGEGGDQISVNLLKSSAKARKEITNLKYELLQTQNMNTVRTLESISTPNTEIVNEFIEDPNITFDIKPGSAYYTFEDGRKVPANIVDGAKQERSVYKSLSDDIKRNNYNIEKIIEEVKDVNELHDIVRRDYNDLKKFGVSLGLNSLDLIVNTYSGAEQLTRTPINYLLENMGLGEASEITPISAVATAFTHFKHSTMDEYQKDIIFEDAIDSWSNLGKFSSQQIAQQLPIVLSMVGTGGVAGSVARGAGLVGKTLMRAQNLSSSSMIGLSSMGGKMNEMTYEEIITGKDLYSDAEIYFKGLGFGITEGAFSYFSTAPILNRGLNRLKGIDTPAGISALEKVTGGRWDFFRNSMRKDILPETVGESFFEGLTTASQNLIDGKPFFENVAESVVVGGVFGFGMSGTPTFYAMGAKNFANQKQLKIINQNTAKVNSLLRRNAQLMYDKSTGTGLWSQVDIEPEIVENLNLIDELIGEIATQEQIVTDNLTKRGIPIDVDAVNIWVNGQNKLAELRDAANSIAADNTKSKQQKEKELQEIGKDFNDIKQKMELFTGEDTWGSRYGLLGIASKTEGWNSEKAKKFREVTEQAKASLKNKSYAKEGKVKKPTQEEINAEADDILLNEEIDLFSERTQKLAKALGFTSFRFETREQAISELTKLYDQAINETTENSKERKNLEDEKKKVIKSITEKDSKTKRYVTNGLSIGSLGISMHVVETMKGNNKSTTGIHEIAHDVTNGLIKKNPEAFKDLTNQLISYLHFTGQTKALAKMRVKNAGLMLETGEYDPGEVFSEFVELLADGKIDLNRQDNFTAIVGKLINEGALKASDNEFKLGFQGENDILAFLLDFGNKLAQGELLSVDVKAMEERLTPKKGKPKPKPQTKLKVAASKTGVSQTLYQQTEGIFEDPNLTKVRKGFDIGNLWKNEIESRLKKGFTVDGKRYTPAKWDGWNSAIMEDIVSDVATGAAGIRSIVKNYKPGKGDVDSVVGYINLLLNKKILGYIPSDLVATTKSLDTDEARQIADTQGLSIDDKLDIKEPQIREERKFSELQFKDVKGVIEPTEDLVNEIKDIITEVLRKSTLLEGILPDINKVNDIVKKQIAKNLKIAMGPISKKVFGFSTTQYAEFIKNNMDIILGAMPINVIKAKAKSKDWKNIFNIEKVSREKDKKVNPETGEITYPGKGIYKITKPSVKDFTRYFTRGKYTTLIARQKSLTQPISKELARIAILQATKDSDFLSDIAEREIGMRSGPRLGEFYISNLLKNIADVLDETASDQRSMDTLNFSKTVSNFADPFKKLGAISVLNSPVVRDGLTRSIISQPNWAQITLRQNLDKFKEFGITSLEVNNIAKDLQGEVEAIREDQFTFEKWYDKTLDNLLSTTNIPVKLETVALSHGYNLKTGTKAFIVPLSEFNILRKEIGNFVSDNFSVEEQAFIWPGLVNPGGFNQWDTTNDTYGVELKNTDVKKRVSTKTKEEKASAYHSLIRDVADLHRNFASEGYKEITKVKGDVYQHGKYWKKFNTLDLIDRIAFMRDNVMPDSISAQKVFKKMVYKLSNELDKWNSSNGEKGLSPQSIMSLMELNMRSMGGLTKISSIMRYIPVMTDKQIIEAFGLDSKDPFVLEHFIPALRMSAIAINYIYTDSSNVEQKQEAKELFDEYLKKYNSGLIPEAFDKIVNKSDEHGNRFLYTEPTIATVETQPFGPDSRQEAINKRAQLLGMNFQMVDLLETTDPTNPKIIGTDSAVANAQKKAAVVNNKVIKSSKVSSGIAKSKTNTNPLVYRELEVMTKALEIARDPNAPVKKIRVFDFDDTLAKSKSQVIYTLPNGKVGKLTPAEFASEGDRLIAEGVVWDFSEFNKVIEGKKGPLFEVAKKIQEARGTEDMFVLTARAPESAVAIKEFLANIDLNIPLKNIIGLGDSSPLAKSSWIVEKASEGYNDFYFADDHTANVEAVKRVLDQIDVKSKVQQAKIRFSKTVDQSMNNIIYDKTGVEPFKEYSNIRAKAQGRDIKTLRLIPYSAEDFKGLLYPLLGKGKKGDAQWKWMQETLIDPYNRGVNDIAIAQNTLSADFKALKNSLEGIPKNLKKKAFGGFTFEDITRVITWDKQGITVEGLSKRDLNKIRDFVAKNPELDAFADQLIALTKGDGYHYPGSNWLAGTITTDFREGLRTNTRKKYLAEWIANIDEAFSEKNLNKLEAVFGSKYREALEDSIQRMKTGSNRNAKIGRLEARFLDYVNNSIGTVMFLNARSAVLQTISAVNFLNWSDNNPYKAAKAFANQPQYWKDFMTLMNSDYLVDRRNGLKINVSESEIAESAKTAKNKTRGVINTLLSKGFVLTQFADSFAIASGGATFYRNRINKYIKEGLSQKEAEKKAFEDFRKTAEESQQSADPSRISQQQATTLGKIVLAFANTPSQYARIQKRAVQDLVNRRGDPKEHVSKIVYYGVIQSLMFTALQSAMFAMMFDEEEDEGILDEKKIKTANSMLDNLLRGMGISGAVASTIKNVVIELYDKSQKPRPEYETTAFKLLDISPPIDIKVSKFRQAMNTWEYNRNNPEAQDPFNVANPAYKAMAYVIASTTNIPLDRLYLKIENIAGALDANNEYWQRVAMLLGWPKWQLQSTKEKEEEKELRKLQRASVKEGSEGRIYKPKPLVTKEQYKKQQTEKKRKQYFDLNKKEQVHKLDSLGLSKSEIRDLKYEKDRVKKLLELMENED